MERPNRVLAFLAYLIPLVGWAIVVLFRRRNTFALYHACQAMALTLAIVAIPVIWGIPAWLVTWVPLFGPPLAAAAFALVIAAYVALIVGWVIGMVNALRVKLQPVLLFGGWGLRFFRALHPHDAS